VYRAAIIIEVLHHNVSNLHDVKFKGNDKKCKPNGIFSKKVKLDYIFEIILLLVKLDMLVAQGAAAYRVSRLIRVLLIASSQSQLI